MTKLFIIISAIITIFGLTEISLAAECRSARGGYCVQTAALAQAQGLENIISGTDVGDLVPGIYRFGLGLVGISALVALIVGGVMYMTAGGSQDQTKRARVWLGNAVFGLVLALLSYLILNTINPDLVRRLDLRLTPIASPPALPTDEAGRPLGSPGSSVTIGRPGQPVDQNLANQCPTSSGCVIRTTGAGTVDCDCGGETRGQSGL